MLHLSRFSPSVFYSLSLLYFFFFFSDPATTEIYTLSLHDALPIYAMRHVGWVERQVRRADSFQQRHAVVAFPWAVMQKFGNDQAGSKATLMAYYGLFALFPLLLLLATVLGFVLSGNPALREQLIDSALGNFPVIGDQLRSEVHPLEGNTTALVIGIA